MIRIDIQAPNLNNIKKTIGTLENKASSILVRAINRAATTAKTTIKKQSTGAPGLYRIKSGEIEKSTKITKANTNTLKAIVTVKGRPRPLSQFAVSPKRIVTYKGKSRNPKRYKAAAMKKHSLIPLDKEQNKPFVAVTHKNFMGVFSRKGKDNKILRNIEVVRKTASGPKKYTYERNVEKLQMHYGPSIPQMIANEKIFRNMETDSGKTLNTRVNHEIELLLRRLG